jgi:hypothetical protein
MAGEAGNDADAGLLVLLVLMATTTCCVAARTRSP